MLFVGGFRLENSVWVFQWPIRNFEEAPHLRPQLIHLYWIIPVMQRTINSHFRGKWLAKINGFL